ncbi:gliding motility lipoprotein GldB [Muricauda sp. JGD-17]|uniref:Gliding motility lipoprotein GldB n=1 Tax=Flagellimonas ochracea TaxID=2696472 RepID=A0A964TDY3_9FLAO|nr:gliding motility lipoprotein GldB [Allomuricauda ochracea]NAY92361.1 gliding motility lipoprotein GldB [Allomuricauda ochracea]
MLIIKRLSKYFNLSVLVGFAFCVMCCFMMSCKEADKTEDTISKTQIDLQILRFDREFAKASPKEIPQLKKKYPYLFPDQFPDSVWIAKLSDTLQQELSEEVEQTFGDFDQETEDLKSLFQHTAYYFPNFEVPKVITLTSDVRYKDRIILTDTLLLIGLDNYLGKDHRFYQGLQRYIASGLDKGYLTSDIASAFSKKVLRLPNNRTFLSRMIYYGKELYLKDKLLPLLSDAQKIGYSEEEMEWARANEEQIWRYFVERELLYSTDSELDRRFLDPAPFSKFRLALDNESPGRLGRYMGWQVVRAFMDKNNIGLQRLLDMPAAEILQESNYKPRK